MDQHQPNRGQHGREFPFEFHPMFRLPAAVFGVRPSTSRVELIEDRFVARFGPWLVSTDLGNIVGAEVTGGFAWPKVIGPAHVSFADGGLTFATTNRRAVCIHFRSAVPGVEPLGLLRHRGLTVTVQDAPALAELLDRRAHGEN